MTVGLASDHGGFPLKERLVKLMKRWGVEVVDFGAYNLNSCDYPDLGLALVRAVLKGRCRYGILACRSGIGFSIFANRFRGIRAALCYDRRAAELSRRHNNANVLVLGGDFVKDGQVAGIVRAWLSADFEGGRHKRRLTKIERLSKQWAH